MIGLLIWEVTSFALNNSFDDLRSSIASDFASRAVGAATKILLQIDASSIFIGIVLTSLFLLVYEKYFSDPEAETMDVSEPSEIDRKKLYWVREQEVSLLVSHIESQVKNIRIKAESIRGRPRDMDSDMMTDWAFSLPEIASQPAYSWLKEVFEKNETDYRVAFELKSRQIQKDPTNLILSESDEKNFTSPEEKIAWAIRVARFDMLARHRAALVASICRANKLDGYFDA